MDEQLHQAKAELAQSEERFRDLFDEAPIAYIFEDVDSRIVQANRTAMRILGVQPGEIPGLFGKSLVPDTPDAQRRLRDALEPLRHGIDINEAVLELRRKDDGRPIWIKWWSRPVPGGKFTRTMFIDITDRMLTEGDKMRLETQNTRLLDEIRNEHDFFGDIIGNSASLHNVVKRIRLVAPTDATVLITGESGTGKELVARAIHKRSRRSSGAFVSVNCAAIPQALIASELFGHEKGAFTGGLQRRLGRFEIASGGTIFLDEIGELPMETQVALLRVLQERDFERLGGSQSIRADVRVIAATNRDLKAAIAKGIFRSDLYYRLNVFPIEMPALRQRPEDITTLVQHFIRRYAAASNKRITNISGSSMDLLRSCPWPGNVRELQNVIERSVILCDSETFYVDESWISRNGAEIAPPTLPLAQLLEFEEKSRIEVALAESRGRVSGPSGAAAKLGIKASSTLESKIKSLKINKSAFKGLEREVRISEASAEEHL
jgi:PAS domain S-box-containing protein